MAVRCPRHGGIMVMIRLLCMWRREAFEWLTVAAFFPISGERLIACSVWSVVNVGCARALASRRLIGCPPFGVSRLRGRLPGYFLPISGERLTACLVRSVTGGWPCKCLGCVEVEWYVWLAVGCRAVGMMTAENHGGRFVVTE
jgi:hypothetical protein